MLGESLTSKHLSFNLLCVLKKYSLCRLCKQVCVLLEGRSAVAGLCPEVGCQESIGLHETVKGSLQGTKHQIVYVKCTMWKVQTFAGISQSPCH